MEQELAETSERLALATSSAQLGVWDLNLTNKKMIWNDRMFELYGIARNSSSNTVDEWINALHPDDRQQAVDLYNSAVSGRTGYNTVFRIVRPDGTILHIKANGIVLRDNTGTAVRMLGINADVTENIRTEQALQNAQKLDSLGILAGGIAHDFNNLLGGIYGYIDIANEMGDSDDNSTYLAKALETIERARGLTQQLLTFAKGGEPVKEVGHLFPFIEDTARFALSGSRILLSVKVADDLWLCDFDRSKIGQVIDNLVINAKQAMPSGGIITISADNYTISTSFTHLAPGNYIRIRIQDTGIGIPKEIQSRIFDPFYTTKSKGHGLGLSTCYSIVNRHNGTIDVESAPGRGSVFTIHLPAIVNASVDAEPQIRWSHSGAGTVLIMDDEDIMLDTITAMLTSFGYSVIGAHDGAEAVALLNGEVSGHRAVAFAIIDLTVPGGKGGVDIINELKTVSPEMPVYVASGYADDPVMADPKAHGFSASINKPFLKAELAEFLNRHLKGSGVFAGK